MSRKRSCVLAMSLPSVRGAMHVCTSCVSPRLYPLPSLPFPSSAQVALIYPSHFLCFCLPPPTCLSPRLLPLHAQRSLEIRPYIVVVFSACPLLSFFAPMHCLSSARLPLPPSFIPCPLSLTPSSPPPRLQRLKGSKAPGGKIGPHSVRSHQTRTLSRPPANPYQATPNS